jgi:hypothetical protein
MRRLRKTFVLTVLVSLAGTVPADAMNCEGPVANVGLSNAGELWVSYGTIGIQRICSTTSTVNSIDPGVCRSWYALLLATRSQHRSVRIYYTEGAPGNPTACSGFQSWYPYTAYFLEAID